MKDFDRTAEEVRGVGGTILGEGQCRVASCIYNLWSICSFYVKVRLEVLILNCLLHVRGSREVVYEDCYVLKHVYFL